MGSATSKRSRRRLRSCNCKKKDVATFSAYAIAWQRRRRRKARKAKRRSKLTYDLSRYILFRELRISCRRWLPAVARRFSVPHGLSAYLHIFIFFFARCASAVHSTVNSFLFPEEFFRGPLDSLLGSMRCIRCICV